MFFRDIRDSESAFFINSDINVRHIESMFY